MPQHSLKGNLRPLCFHFSSSSPTMATTSKQYKAVGEDLWKNKTEKIVRQLSLCLIATSSKEPLSNQTKNAELFALTYGALVVQLIQDYEDYAEVNKQLEKMGYNIGTRLIEEFLAKSSLGRCADFKDVGEVIAKVDGKVLPHLLWADFDRLGWIQIFPEHHTERHPCATATTDVANDEIVGGYESRFDVLTDV